MTEENIRELSCATILQAVRDFVASEDYEHKIILRELRSAWMDLLTQGLSCVVAEQLEKHPDDIVKRIRKCKED